MNKLTKLGIVTFSAVTLSAAVPTLVRAEENVAPQPNVAAKPNVAQPTPAPKPNGSWVDFSMLDPIAKPKPKLDKEVSKPAEKPVEEPAPVEKPSTEGNILANGTDEAIAEDKKNAEIEKKYNVDPTNQLPEPGLPIITPEPEQPITDSKEMKKMVAEDLAYKKGAAKTQEEYNKLIAEANEKLWAADGVDMDELIHRLIPEKPGAVPAFSDISVRKYEIQADFLDADLVQKHGYTTESRIDSPKQAEVSSTWNVHDKDSADGILTAKKFSDYTFSHVVKASADHPDIDPDPKVVRVSYDAAYALRGSGYKNGKGDNLFRYYFIYTKNKPVEEKPKDPQPAETEKPAEISKPAETVEPTVQPKPAENKPVENKPAETPVPSPKPAENPQPEVKPVEQPQPAKPVEPAENAGLPKIPYRTNNPKRWFNGAGRPTLTTNDLAAPLPVENVEKTSYGWWTAEPDLLHAGSHIKVNTFNSNFNNPMFENGKEIKFKGSGFGDMDSRFKPALVRVKVPELEGMNYEAYTIFYEVPNKNGNPTYGTNRTLQGGGISLTIKSKEKKEDIQVYTLTKDRKLEELYYPGFPSEETNRYDEKTKTHSYNLFGETYDTYVFLFKNPAEKPAEQVKPEVKPSEQPKPDKQPSVPTVPADQPQPAKPEKPAEKPSEKPVVPDTPKPVAPAVPDQPQPAKPVEPAEKPSEKPVNPVTPVAPITPTTPVTPTLNPAIPNNTRVLSNKAGSVQVHGSEATLKNVSYIKVEETKPTSLESKDYKAFDIHLYDANGKAIQPNGMVLVSLSADKPVENVYYVAPDGTLQSLKFKQDTDKVTFETNHFSIYAMTFKVAASRNNGGSTTPVPVVNSSNTEQKGNDASSTKTQAESLATKTETISKQVAKTLPNTGENHSILATLFGMLTLTAGLFSFRKESE
ncbi:LPXTG cell wall anchor domain-containing protein [Streptococcus pseudopneumoniae]|uniref:LPXTG cell wall anchor domain-containing protein n=1 Tax=Streptococcus pseudopneumoniae TaxID=257758 RepID=UPI00061BA2F2|nr:LPXTG cell wall anchor domain-containing protein [Streptococcus pseudopneumoniae]MBF9639268.1 LPXTG cell wall anchor domain-containing protein [Streptococcus pseudopneumoniae]MBF9641752.1 LPXTG cell wall anchor domain-containing protein [Streptococcus pseudopneumoniae]MBF9652580.1 LPXTG cell wall anchor domain-containing protein [Streptococcus pseudopneumoniae]MBF9662361.1 LPXTG cell wall anchor domain-containing protein [Streptococcus pseudopneumoniae]MBF9685074.1 LPXTG cell wall anchor do